MMCLTYNSFCQLPEESTPGLVLTLRAKYYYEDLASENGGGDDDDSTKLKRSLLWP